MTVWILFTEDRSWTRSLTAHATFAHLAAHLRKAFNVSPDCPDEDVAEAIRTADDAVDIYYDEVQVGGGTQRITTRFHAEHGVIRPCPACGVYIADKFKREHYARVHSQGVR